tara:strand:+ start:549 stop:689 length:141 start_codon:yes stop_codon:yes gene_type:complete
MKKIIKKNNSVKNGIDREFTSSYLPKLFKFNRVRKLILKKVNKKDL